MLNINNGQAKLQHFIERQEDRGHPWLAWTAGKASETAISHHHQHHLTTITTNGK